MKDETKGLYGPHEHLAGDIARRILKDCRRKVLFLCSLCGKPVPGEDLCEKCAAQKEGRAA